MLYACYLLRAPLWDTAVKPVASTVHSALAPVPLVGGMASYAFMMLEYMQKVSCIRKREGRTVVLD